MTIPEPKEFEAVLAMIEDLPWPYLHILLDRIEKRRAVLSEPPPWARKTERKTGT